MKKNIVVGIGLLLTITSCNWYSDCNQVPLSKEDAEWFYCYNLGDTIVLKSNLGNYDSLMVTVKESEYSPCNKFELGPNQYQSMLIILESINVIEVECTKRLRSISASISVSKYVEPSRGIAVYNLWSVSPKCEDEKTDSTMNCENPVWLKIPYFKDSLFVYKFDDRNMRSQYPYVNSEYPCAVKSFHWSKEHGLVQYETEDNEVYELVYKTDH